MMRPAGAGAVQLRARAPALPSRVHHMASCYKYIAGVVRRKRLCMHTYCVSMLSTVLAYSFFSKAPCAARRSVLLLRRRRASAAPPTPAPGWLLLRP